VGNDLSDVLGPYPEAALTKNKYIVVVEDVFTKWVEAFTAHKYRAKNVVEILQKEIFARYGVPKFLVSDNDAVFINNQMEKMCQSQGIRQLFSAIYHQ